MKASLTRREALARGGGAAGAFALDGCVSVEPIAGSLGGADWQRGHLVRDQRFPPPQGPMQEVKVLIAGGGAAGLSAGWRFHDAGFDDFVLLELEDATGGNARSGRNAVSRYPLGAHYLPVPNREASALRHMLRQFGMIVGDGPDRPTYDPYQLCADLEERLLWRGAWQEGLYPQSGLSHQDIVQRDRFQAAMAQFRVATGHDRRPAFAIPMAYSSADPRWTSLDRISFAQWLRDGGYTSSVLLAYLRYCCRDDYGTEPDQVSAWAGIHYFAGRRGWAAGADGDRELTWPEGNGRLVSLMARRIATKLRTAHSVFRVIPDGDGVEVHAYDHGARKSARWRAQVAILAMPHFVAARVAPEFCEKGAFSYAPWVTANITLSRRPEGKGAPLAWDNVSSASDALGYVVANHQTDSGADGRTVITWYLPLSRETPENARKIVLTRSLESWQAIVRDDLLAMNPDLSGAIERIDVWRWGHAMIRPTIGFLSDPARVAARQARPPVLFAHSDLSGLSLFEEAHYSGVAAAERAMSHLSHGHASLL